MTALLSNAERKFADNPSNFDKENAKYLRHKIKKKLAVTVDDLLVILKNRDDMRLDVSVLDSLFESQTGLQLVESELSNSQTKKKDKFSKYENW